MNTLNDTHQNRPPRTAATDDEDAVQYSGGGVVSVWSGYAKVPEGKCWLEIEAFSDLMTFKFARTEIVSDVSGFNGVTLKDGTRIRVYVDPAIDAYLDIAGNGYLKWRRVGHICERSRQ